MTDRKIYIVNIRVIANRMQKVKGMRTRKITATSGKDVLGITKGDKENSYIVHFSDSAMVSRAVARGYITVNGADVELTEDTKRQLLKVDKASKCCERKDISGLCYAA